VPRACTSCYLICGALCACLADTNSDSSVLGSIVVEASDPATFYAAYRSLKELYPAVKGLVDAYKAYDLPQFVSSHRAMTRRIARLRKLLTILRGMTIDVGGCTTSYADLARPVTEFLSLMLRVLEYFRGMTHRARDPVHEFLYPVILQALDALTRIELVYEPSTQPPGARFVYTYSAGTRSADLWIELPDGGAHRDITDKELEYLAGQPHEERVYEVAVKRLQRILQYRKEIPPWTLERRLGNAIKWLFDTK